MLGKRIKSLRASLGLSQVEFGKTLNVTKQSVSNWENGNIQPSIDMLLKISSLYSVSTDYLLGITNNKTLDVTNLSDRQVAYIQALVNDLRNMEK